MRGGLPSGKNGEPLRDMGAGEEGSGKAIQCSFKKITPGAEQTKTGG